MDKPEYLKAMIILHPDQVVWLEKNVKIFKRSELFRELLDNHIKKCQTKKK
jgi:hypothetical protein